MMAEVQPFISGAISKTINMPSNTEVKDIEECYMYSWARELKAVAIYRDGCKQTQPLSGSLQHIKKDKLETMMEWGSEKLRKRLPETRPSLTHKYSIGGHDGYITAGFYPEGHRLGEVFVQSAKEGSTVSGLMDAFATIFSIALQYGVPLSHLAGKIKGIRFEPSGVTGNPEIPMAKSIVDYVARWLILQDTPTPESSPGPTTVETESSGVEEPENGNGAEELDKSAQIEYPLKFTMDSPACRCGSLMVPNGKCYSCPNCGEAGACD
jgi:ribonucleoside-diphosphate reductase alpha chain